MFQLPHPVAAVSPISARLPVVAAFAIFATACASSASEQSSRDGEAGDEGGTGTGGADVGAQSADTAGERPVSADCAAMPTSLLCDPLRKMPATIKETGLFPSAPDFSKRSARLIQFVPDPQLWSDGMEKQRFLLLPAGAKIDNSDRKQWKFPVGTIIVKTFFDDGGANGALRPIETRFIRAGNNLPYEFFVYQWNAARTDATLVVNDIDGDPTQEVLVPIIIKRTVGGQPFLVNGGMPFQHSLPSRNACGECHEVNGMVAQTFIAFDELRLNAKLDAAATKTQLQQLAELGVFTMAPPAQPATITDASNDNGRLLRIKRFVFGNCVHCHNGQSLIDLHPELFVQNTVGVEVMETQSVKPPPGMLRIFPADPAKSVVYVQTQRTMLPPPVNTDGQDIRLRAMPPVGVADVAADQAALADMRDWILSLPPRGS